VRRIYKLINAPFDRKYAENAQHGVAPNRSAGPLIHDPGERRLRPVVHDFRDRRNRSRRHAE
jgi:hypothetical protein